jgi:hypothetical protein
MKTERLRQSDIGRERESERKRERENETDKECARERLRQRETDSLRRRGRERVRDRVTVTESGRAAHRVRLSHSGVALARMVGLGVVDLHEVLAAENPVVVLDPDRKVIRRS